jgi:hypothetical protein
VARTAARASDWARVVSSGLVVVVVGVVVVVLVAEVEVGGVMVVEAEDVDAEADVDAIFAILGDLLVVFGIDVSERCKDL